MKRVGKEPRLLPNVMEAIARLKEKNGSSQKQIVEHVSDVVFASYRQICEENFYGRLPK